MPVYAILISLIIPEKRLFGIFSLQGATLMILYLLGFGMAIFSAYLLNKVLKLKTKSYFVVEMPNYKLPLFKNVKVKKELEKEATEIRTLGKEKIDVLHELLNNPELSKVLIFGRTKHGVERLSKTLEDRGVVYSPNPVPGNKPITLGHQYSIMGFLPEKTSRQDPSESNFYAC